MFLLFVLLAFIPFHTHTPDGVVTNEFVDEDAETQQPQRSAACSAVGILRGLFTTQNYQQNTGWPPKPANHQDYDYDITYIPRLENPELNLGNICHTLGISPKLLLHLPPEKKGMAHK